MANTMALINPVFVNTTLNATEPLAFGSTTGKDIGYFKETASQTYRIGDLIYLDTNGTIAVCTTTAGATGGNVLNSAIAGIATQAASGTTGQTVYGHAIRPDDIYLMNIYHHTVASATSAQTQLGGVFGIQKSITTDNAQAVSVWAVDIENAVENTILNLAYVQVIGFPKVGLLSDGTPTQSAAVGDTYGLVYVRFLPITLKSNGTTWQRNLQLA